MPVVRVVLFAPLDRTGDPVFVNDDEHLHVRIGELSRDGADQVAAAPPPVHPRASRIHHCLGAPLARLEARVAFTALLDRLPQLRLADGFQPRWRPVALMHGLVELPVLT